SGRAAAARQARDRRVQVGSWSAIFHCRRRHEKSASVLRLSSFVLRPPMNTVEGIALDFELSPYTGWTRAHWERVLARATYGYVLAAERQGSMARALYPHDYRPMP